MQVGYWDDGLSCNDYPLELNISKAGEFGPTAFEQIVPGMRAFQCTVFDTTVVNKITVSGPIPESAFDAVIANLSGESLCCTVMCRKLVFCPC